MAGTELSVAAMSKENPRLWDQSHFGFAFHDRFRVHLRAQGGYQFGERDAIFSGKGMRMPEGTIKKLTDKGFGFINTGSGKDLFFHSSSVQGGKFATLQEGQTVSYTEGRGPKGPCAENVKPV